MRALEGEVRVGKGQLRDHHLHRRRHFCRVAHAELAQRLGNRGVVRRGSVQLEGIGLLHVGQMLHAHGHFAGIVESGLQRVAWIAGAGACHAGGERRSGLRRKRVFTLGSLVGFGLGRCAGRGRLLRVKPCSTQRQKGRTHGPGQQMTLGAIQCFSSSICCMMRISARCPVSTSVTKSKISASCPAPGWLNSSFTMTSAPPWC